MKFHAMLQRSPSSTGKFSIGRSIAEFKFDIPTNYKIRFRHDDDDDDVDDDDDDDDDAVDDDDDQEESERQDQCRSWSGIKGMMNVYHAGAH